MIRTVIRKAFQSGLLGFSYPSDFGIKECLRWRMHQHERATVNYLRSFLKHGDTFIDVGAHVGYFAEFAGRLVGRTGCVYAFEPFLNNFKLLSHNCRHMPQVKTIQAAVSDTSGQGSLFEHSTSSSSHALTDLSGSGKVVPVNTITLDNWADENKIHQVHMMLIDVEGHEISVLRGMHEIIKNNPGITIILEYCPSHYQHKDVTILALLEEIEKMRLFITCALGQSQKYSLPDYKKQTDIVNLLGEILTSEIAGGSDYVNIVMSK